MRIVAALHITLVSALRGRDAARATGWHTEERGDHVLRENLRELRRCGLRRVDQLRRSMKGGRCGFGGLGLRGGYIAMLMCLGERQTRGRGRRRRWRERLRAHVMEWGRCWRQEARRGRCGGSKDSIKEGLALGGGSSRLVHKGGSRGGRGRGKKSRHGHFAVIGRWGRRGGRHESREQLVQV